MLLQNPQSIKQCILGSRSIVDLALHKVYGISAMLAVVRSSSGCPQVLNVV